MLFAWDVFDAEMVVLEGGEPSCYPPIHLFGIFPECEVGVVCQYRDRFFRGCQVWSPVFQAFENCQEFSFVDVIVSLRWDKGGRVVGNRVQEWFLGAWVGFTLL